MSRVRPRKGRAADTRTAPQREPSNSSEPSSQPAPNVPRAEPDGGSADLARARRFGHRPGGYAVQRMLYDRARKVLNVSEDYAQQPIAWKDGLGAGRKPTEDDPTLWHLYRNHTESFKKWLSQGAGEQVDGLAKHTATGGRYTSQQGQLILEYLPDQPSGDLTGWEGDHLATFEALERGLRAAQKVALTPWYGKFRAPSEIDGHYALLPQDYIPQPSDLPGKDVDMVSEKSKSVVTDWNRVCTLIALLQTDNDYAKAKSITDDSSIDSLDSAVQALHDHYRGQDIEYDDTAEHRQLMSQWGYSLAFTGPTSWKKLHKKYRMKTGKKYLVEIHGHTVMVTLKKALPKTTDGMSTPSEYYETHSDEFNYPAQDELSKKVEYVYAPA